MHDNSADGVLDFVGILLVNVVLPDSDGVVGGVRVVGQAMTCR